MDVEIEVRNQSLIIRSAKRSRVGWDKAFSEMSEQGDDDLLDKDLTAKWDQAEWEW
jgi:antitoxin MazE